MMHSLTTPPAYITTPISTKSQKSTCILSSIRFQRICACHRNSKDVSYHENRLVQRRNVTLGLGSAVVLGLNAGDQNAYAARRPPPPPPEEKKDPNVSGVQAKVLASKKRKEAMKEAIAKLREKGKPVNESPSK